VDDINLSTFAPRLRERSLDLALTQMRGHSAEDDRSFDDLNIEFLFDDRLVVAAGMQSQWARRRKIDLVELVNERWILTTHDSWNYNIVAEAFRLRGLEMPKIILKTLSVHLRTNLLATGQYITAFPSAVLHLYADRFSLKELPLDLPLTPWPVAIATLKNRTLSPVVERFIECCREVAKSYAKRPRRSAHTKAS
jgi:DNA-binding transcriptional LysR family regulator